MKQEKKKKKQNLPDNQSKKRVPKWYFIVLVSIPIIFFILLEISLRLFEYGFDNRQWVEATEGKLFLNPEIAKKYFYTTQRIPFSNGDVFDAIKKDNAFRVFVLGGSSAAGYPFSPLGSFSHYIKGRLKLVYPSSEIEVVNISMTAVNSFTLRDLFPGVLEKEPDLVLIYAGHNEYYGALGVGSMESLGTSREIVNLLLYLNKYKTVELLRNTIKWVMGLFSNDDHEGGTLMSRMAKEQYIEFGSETYNDGIKQFEGNLQDILEMAKNKNVPVILSTLTSNLKDLPPFISVKTDTYPPAERIFREAKQELSKSNYLTADSLFRFAKDLDALRFRAPEEMNKTIRSLSKEFNLPLVDADSAFNSISPDGIVGNNLMTDHLHPTLEGYLFLGKLFFEKIKESNLLPKTTAENLTEAEQDSLTKLHFSFTKLDSAISDFRIKLLKNDWPFVSKENKKRDILNPLNNIDSLAEQVLKDKITWEEAHRRLAAYYLVHKDTKSFLAEMDAVITQYPVVIEYYDYVTNILLQVKDYKTAYKYLKAGYDIKPNAYKTKWLGTINLYNNNLKDSEKYFKESLIFDNKDAQVWYNLAGVYVKQNKYKEALDNVNKALSIKPDYDEAVNLQKQLQRAVN